MARGMSVGDLNADATRHLVTAAWAIRFATASIGVDERRWTAILRQRVLVGVEPRGIAGRTAWFILDCDGADKHLGCAGKSGKTTITGTLSTRPSL